MAFCTNCGSRIDGDLKFCTNCGAPLETVEQPGPETMLDIADSPNPEQPAYQQPSFEPQSSYQQPEPAPAQPPYQQQAESAPSSQPTFTPVGEAQTAPVDTGSIGWAILGFIIPLVGFILFFVWHNTKPQSARMSLIGAVVGLCAGILLRIMG